MAKKQSKPVVAYWLEFGRKGNKCQVHHAPPDVSNMFDYHAFYREEQEAHYRYIVVIPTSRLFDMDKMREFVRRCHEQGTYQIFNVTVSDTPQTHSFRRTEQHGN